MRVRGSLRIRAGEQNPTPPLAVSVDIDPPGAHPAGLVTFSILLNDRTEWALAIPPAEAAYLAGLLSVYSGVALCPDE